MGVESLILGSVSAGTLSVSTLSVSSLSVLRSLLLGRLELEPTAAAQPTRVAPRMETAPVGSTAASAPSTLRSNSCPTAR